MKILLLAAALCPLAANAEPSFGKAHSFFLTGNADVDFTSYERSFAGESETVDSTTLRLSPIFGYFPFEVMALHFGALISLRDNEADVASNSVTTFGGILGLGFYGRIDTSRDRATILYANGFFAFIPGGSLEVTREGGESIEGDIGGYGFIGGAGVMFAFGEKRGSLIRFGLNVAKEDLEVTLDLPTSPKLDESNISVTLGFGVGAFF